MSKNIITVGSEGPVISGHSEKFSIGTDAPARAEIAFSLDWLSTSKPTVIEVVLEPQKNGTFITRYSERVLNPPA